MVKNFSKDLEKGKEAEVIVSKVLVRAGYEVKDISNDPNYYHVGDL